MVYACEILGELRQWTLLAETFSIGKPGQGLDVHEDGNGAGRPVGTGLPGSGVDQGTGRKGDREFLSLERELTVFLRRARANQGEMAREVHPDLESAAYGLLVRLDECGRQRATALAAYIGVGKATMSRQLRALEDLGRVREARRARYVSQLAHWDQREVAELARLLHQLNLGMEK